MIFGMNEQIADGYATFLCSELRSMSDTTYNSGGSAPR